MNALFRRASAFLLIMAAGSLEMRSQSFQTLSTIDPSLNAPVGGCGDSWAPIVSPDGRYVLFASSANNLLLLSNNLPMPVSIPVVLNAFLRDRTNGTTSLVSVNLSGTAGGNGNSVPVQLSTNGQWALFESSASDLVTGDTNGSPDIFVRNLANGTTSMVSANTNGLAANAASRNATMTPDGRYVAFVSAASDLVAGDTNQIEDVFVRDLQTQTTTLVSVGAIARSTNFFYFGSDAPGISADGRYVSFCSTATNIVPGVPLGRDVYVRDLQLGTTTVASAFARTVLTNNNLACFNSVISPDGRFIAYEGSVSTSSIPPFITASFGWVFRYDRSTDTTSVAETNAAITSFRISEIQSMDMTPDGRFVALVANTNGTTGATTCVRLWDASSGTAILVSGDTGGLVPVNSTCDWPMVDATGRYVSFLSNPSNLTANAVLGDYHLYRRDTQLGLTILLDASTNGTGSPVTSMTMPRLSVDGRFVAFEAADSGLVPDDRNRDSDVFLRDLTTGASEVISAHHATLATSTGNGPSLGGSWTADGRYVAFASEADNLLPGDTNQVRDVFVRDLVNHSLTLVSVSTNGTVGDASSSEPSITPDGHYVVFSSLADNLVAGDTNKAQDVFVRDLWSGTTTLVSSNRLGTGPGYGPSYSPSISQDGRYVLFVSQAINLSLPAAAGGNLYLRDLQAGTNYLLTRNTVKSASMTPDGQRVVFLEGTFGPFQISIWDTVQARTTYTTNFLNYIFTLAADPGVKAAVFWGGGQLTNLYSLDLSSKTMISIASGVRGGPKPGYSFSSDGGTLAYSAFVGNSNQVFLYNYSIGATTLVSHNNNNSGPANGDSDSPTLSPNGQFILYRSTAVDLVPGMTTGVPQIILYDRQTGSNSLITVNQTGLAANNRSLTPIFSPDGSMGLFNSWASDIRSGDFNHDSDVLSFPLLFLTALPDDEAHGIWLSWPLDSSKNYTPQFRAGLSDQTWHNLTGTVTNNGLKIYFHDASPASDQRLYRVIAN